MGWLNESVHLQWNTLGCNLAPHGAIWRHLAPHGAMWRHHMAPCGAIWRQMAVA
jgi:hypothetical protein